MTPEQSSHLRIPVFSLDKALDKKFTSFYGEVRLASLLWFCCGYQGLISDAGIEDLSDPYQQIVEINRQVRSSKYLIY
jgi:hypothetical protein